MLRFRVLGASFLRFGCFVFEIWVLRFRVLGASCFGLRFRVLRFRNYLIGDAYLMLYPSRVFFLISQACIHQKSTSTFAKKREKISD